MVVALMCNTRYTRCWNGDGLMVGKKLLETATLYVPQGKVEDRLIERMIAAGAIKDRSFNYMLIQAIEEFLEREESE